MQSLPFTVLWGRAVRSRDADKNAARRNSLFRGYGYYINSANRIHLRFCKCKTVRSAEEIYGRRDWIISDYTFEENPLYAIDFRAENY